MKHLLLFAIKWYWHIIPASKRGRCIFRMSCSQHVYKTTRENGLISGLKALVFRYKNCRPGFETFKNPITQETQVLLKNNQVIPEKDIAKRFIN
ncbi:membrane protein insertion efficiency factor YidD [Aureisphaera galaxeae]|uniref:membrane protein insertion efficiency factor YidD n=1 Tax=Aureisphaera galaxeae TaxID=1538023 RepID=UPI002350C70E|nr:membrane protein insertion efficiency factor YidD [Aureisphaera galaxeae]MDC8002733.1 membrane protein insertion efficiency factor YidD [Aureisphaera galaxeae]